MLYLPDSLVRKAYEAIGRSLTDCIVANWAGDARLLAWFMRGKVVVAEEQLPQLAQALRSLGEIRLDNLTLELILAAEDGASRIRRHLADYSRFPKALGLNDRSAIIQAEKAGAVNVWPAKVMYLAQAIGVSEKTAIIAESMGVDPMLNGLKLSEWVLTQSLMGPYRPEGEELPALLAWWFFGTAQLIKSLMEKTGKSLHDVGQLRFPTVGAVWDKKAWAAFVHRAPTVAPFLSVADKIQAHLGRVPESKEELLSAVAVLTAAGGKDAIQMVLLASGVAISGEEMTDYEEEMAKESPVKTLPPTVEMIEGEYSVRMHEAGDPVLLTAGLLTQCCQHLHGAGASCARNAWEEATAGILGVYRGEYLYAQAFVWMNKKKTKVIIDSLELLAKADASKMANLVFEFTKQFSPDIEVWVGVTSYGATKTLSKLSSFTDSKRKAPKPSFELDYTDADEVVRLH